MGLTAPILTMKKFSLLSLSLFLLIAFTGYESTGANKSESDDEDEYEYVTSTNSRIPVRSVRAPATTKMEAVAPWALYRARKPRITLAPAVRASVVTIEFPLSRQSYS